MRKVHLNYLPFKCQEESKNLLKKDCNSSFASRSALNSHLKNKHVRKKEKDLLDRILAELEKQDGH
jgi:hypothetical protein